MPLEFQCVECRKTLRVADGAAGRKARCPDCGTIQNVPAPATDSYREAETHVWSEPTGGSPFSDPSNKTGGAAGTQNPYQSPQADGPVPFHPRFTLPVPRHVVEARVQGPAIALAVLAILMLTLLGVGSAFQVVLVATGETDEDAIVGLIGSGMSAAVQAVILIGALKMRRLQAYSLAVAAAVLAVLPCFGCCLVGMPLGVWALVVLADPHVRAAFT